jgi:hypothetical protein
VIFQTLLLQNSRIPDCRWEFDRGLKMFPPGIEISVVIHYVHYIVYNWHQYSFIVYM